MKKNVILLSLVTVLFAFSACTKGEDSDGKINGHKYVDLGLSVKWATCNIGADNSEESGDYFAWGETTPKETYTYENYMAGDIDYNIAGNAQYDAARANWGGSWRMPTKVELQELMNNCTSQWTTKNGVNGRLFTSKINGNSIFLPAAGILEDSSFDGVGEGAYPSATLSEIDNVNMYYLRFDSEKVVVKDYGDRVDGLVVRPVSE